jgi:hypothetical protein
VGFLFLWAKNPARTSRNQTGKSYWYPDFTNRADQKFNGLNPGDSANPNTTKVFAFFAKISLVTA